MKLGKIVYTRPGAYSVQGRCAAIVTKVHDDDRVDLTVFPGDGVAPFTMKSVRRADPTYQERSDKEIFWYAPEDE